MAGYKKAGMDLDALLEPWQSGDGNAAATGYKINGADLNTKYAPASVGTAYLGGTGYKQGGADIGPRFAAKGSRSTVLPFDGDTFIADNPSRGPASLTLTLNSDGTYTIVRMIGSAATTIGSGTWLPSGEAASNWSCQYSYSTSLVTVVGDASNSNTNGAASISALTSDRAFQSNSTANFTGGQAGQTVAVTLKLYRSGVLRSTTGFTFKTSADGN
ncbi:hypothetical protein LQ772_06905 [Frateuria edaphi]|uniref:hypothetical protein n=1 Tax=Frateuria edaphi TaxID=2898793 RepID=UPI001E4CE052|nr:hypothetical protein [Frateuria edaphi]UGB47015.1 hypothetical protein LQ772_06905 [Frateuria edaphi]